MKHGKTILATVGLLALVLSVTPQVQAEMIDDQPPGLTMQFMENAQGPPDHVTPPGLAIAGTRFRYGHTHHGPVEITIEVDADADPFLSTTLTAVNTTGTAQDFFTLVTLPIFPPLPNGTLTGGSVSFTLIDMNQDGAELSTIDDTTPIYQSRIDGIDWQPLMTAPQSWKIDPNQTVGFGPEDFGIQGPSVSLVGPPALNTIAVELNATISPWDSAFVVATFVVEDIPEPGTIVLLSVSGLAVFLRRRRRHV